MKQDQTNTVGTVCSNGILNENQSSRARARLSNGLDVQNTLTTDVLNVSAGVIATRYTACVGSELGTGQTLKVTGDFRVGEQKATTLRFVGGLLVGVE